MTPLCFLIKFKYNLKYTQYFKTDFDYESKLAWKCWFNLFCVCIFSKILIIFSSNKSCHFSQWKALLFNHKFFAQKNSIVKWNGIHLPPTQKIFSSTKSTYQNNLNQWIGTWLIKLNDPFNGLNLVSIKSIKIPGGSPCGMQSMRFFVIN